MDFMESLQFFLKPRKVIKETLHAPSLAISTLLVVLPWLLFALILAFLGFGLDGGTLASLAAMVAAAIVFWLIGSAFLYVLLFVLKGKSKPFVGIASALSLLEVHTLAIIALFIIGLLVMPGLIPLGQRFAQASNGRISSEAFLAEFDGLSKTFTDNAGDVGLMIFALLIILLLLNFIYCFALVIKELFDSTSLGALVGSVALLFAGILIPFLMFGSLNVFIRSIFFWLVLGQTL